jgi:hypothetical protein
MTKAFKALTIIISCGKDKLCNQVDNFSGIIVQQLDILASPKAGDVGDNNYVIVSDSLYQKAFSGSISIPTIDFNSYSLLGQYGSGSCKISYQKNVESDSINHTYHYKLTIHECWTFTKKLCFDDNWALVPKIPNGWTVTFENENI